MDPARSQGYKKINGKALVDGRWTLAFRDEESCKTAMHMIEEEIKLLSDEVHRRLKPLLSLENSLSPSSHVQEDSPLLPMPVSS